jgi:CheY-like chemotaxis protein
MDHSESSHERVRIVVVDDNQPFRAALCELIAGMAGFVLVGEASSGEEALGVVARWSPQLVLMDVVMPGMGGAAAARSILGRDRGVAVMLISVDDPVGYLGDDSPGDRVACVRKQELDPDRLRTVWAGLRPDRP